MVWGHTAQYLGRLSDLGSIRPDNSRSDWEESEKPAWDTAPLFCGYQNKRGQRIPGTEYVVFVLRTLYDVIPYCVFLFVCLFLFHKVEWTVYYLPGPVLIIAIERGII